MCIPLQRKGLGVNPAHFSPTRVTPPTRGTLFALQQQQRNARDWSSLPSVCQGIVNIILKTIQRRMTITPQVNENRCKGSALWFQGPSTSGEGTAHALHRPTGNTNLCHCSVGSTNLTIHRSVLPTFRQHRTVHHWHGWARPSLTHSITKSPDRRWDQAAPTSRPKRTQSPYSPHSPISLCLSQQSVHAYF